MNLLKDESGYTLIEMLVAISLLFILLFFTTRILGFISVNPQVKIKTYAIEKTRDQMNMILIHERYEALEQELKHNLIMKQNIRDVQGLVKISITIQDINGKEIYRLSAYAKKKQIEKN